MARHQNIILLGPPCAGKSTLGQALAARHRWQFQDGDRCLLSTFARNGGLLEDPPQTIAALWQRVGRTYFRWQETVQLRHWSEQMPPLQHTVIAPGGGVGLCESNVMYLKGLGLCIALSVDWSVAQKRLTARRRERMTVHGIADEANYQRRQQKYADWVDMVFRVCEPEESPEDTLLRLERALALKGLDWNGE